ncbi:haloalkane dehalogenase [Dongshaea marina]|uniref:haloalkane dehalogenase n=1 Tax=Dongshaea marina TaxID=2047966 RepID=UPI000D3EC887|nr:haloalkane dehalogenase [Dongshaea marina]
MRYIKKRQEIYGKKMAYIDEGEGEPIIFLHGNPTSSYLWRNILPYMEGKGRVIAPDLIGMGDSEKLDNSDENSYKFFEHAKYIFKLLDTIDVKENVTLVIQDWGSALGFYWAHTHPESIKGIAFFEAMIAPVPSWDAFPDEARDIFQAFRSDLGEDLILNKNLFVEELIQKGVIRALSKEEMDEYRRPFLNSGEDRRPSLTWPREIPVAGKPSGTNEIMSSYSRWLTTTQFPKLFINAEPGALISTKEARDYVRSWPNVTEVTVEGIHYVQEDSPDEIGVALQEWYKNLS